MRRVGVPAALLGIEPKVHCSMKYIPLDWSPRGRWRSGPMHTFTDDYRQEFFWRRPEEGLIVALSAGIVTAPDYSVYPQDPRMWAEYQAWRSALIAAYWQQNGVTVLPVVSFNTRCERWVKPGSMWAIRGPAQGNEVEFNQFLRWWIPTAYPSALVVFGRMPYDLEKLGVPLLPRALVTSKCTSGAQKEGGAE